MFALVQATLGDALFLWLSSHGSTSGLHPPPLSSNLCMHPALPFRSCSGGRGYSSGLPSCGSVLGPGSALSCVQGANVLSLVVAALSTLPVGSISAVPLARCYGSLNL